MPAVTIRDVAAEAGVAIATVSRVVHGHPQVGPGLRARVEKAMADLGYQPDATAQAMRTRSTRTIACAVRDSSIPEFATFTRAAEAVMRDAGYTLMLANTDEDTAQELDLIKVLGRRRVDGLLMTRSDDSDPAVGAALAKLGIPVVYIDRDAEHGADSVVLDHAAGMRAAIDHLVDGGHRRIALVTGRPSMRPARQRLAAYEASLADHGLPIDRTLIAADSFYADQSLHRVLGMLDATPPPTAIIAGGMALLPAVLRGVRQRGLQVGRDVAVVAGCDSELAELATPSVTAIRWNVPAWGRRAAELLLETLSSSQRRTGPGREIVLPTELVVRESSGDGQSPI
ncbi:substrate-binding domain-containing protein [Fodinicurvata sp. EGI_FJ10296]|uniref:LacI family DNA-binding transcriptional regulator n=1 Tax=Fodinicurvata sp. EGI_FJ10296 TaxID=3231908 RepID=UPI003456CF7B